MIAMVVSLLLALILLVFIASPVEAEIARWPGSATETLVVSFDGHGFSIG